MTTSYTGPSSSDTHDDPESQEAGQPTVDVVAAQEGLNLVLGRKDFPAPELIPPSIVRRRAVGAAKRRVGIALVGLLGLLILLFVFGHVQLSQANSQLAVTQQTLREAEAAKARYDNVPTVYAAVDAARSELTQAMGNEVQVARLVSDLATIMPANVSLTTVSIVVGAEEKPTTSASATTNEDVLLVGTVAFAGEASSVDDVSAWIDTLRGQPDYQNVILTEVSRDTTTGIYTFTNTAELTDQALSGRYVEATQ